MNKGNRNHIELNKKTSYLLKLLKKTKVLIKLTATENTGSFTTAQKMVEKAAEAFCLD